MYSLCTFILFVLLLGILYSADVKLDEQWMQEEWVKYTSPKASWQWYGVKCRIGESMSYSAYARGAIRRVEKAYRMCRFVLSRGHLFFNVPKNCIGCTSTGVGQKPRHDDKCTRTTWSWALSVLKKDITTSIRTEKRKRNVKMYWQYFQHWFSARADCWGIDANCFFLVPSPALRAVNNRWSLSKISFCL